MRSGHESSQIEAVMDGDLDPFMHSYLTWAANNKKNAAGQQK